MDGKKYQLLFEQFQSKLEALNGSFVSLKKNEPVIEFNGLSQVVVTTLVIVVGLIVCVSIWGVK